MNKNGEIKMVVGDMLTHKVFNLGAMLFEFLCLLFIFFFFQVVTDDNVFTYPNFY